MSPMKYLRLLGIIEGPFTFLRRLVDFLKSSGFVVFRLVYAKPKLVKAVLKIDLKIKTLYTHVFIFI